MSRITSMAADWPALNTLLDEVLALPVDERATWIEGLSGEQSRFKDTLQRLLLARGGVETDSFLNELPRLSGLAEAAQGGTPVAGALVGPYRLIREIGQGGMGTVWLAERADGQLKRQVALKLPRIAWDGSLAERMGRERDILATLTHPLIARLYDAGTDSAGRPYLAMEHVQGRAIDDYCAAHALPVSARLALLRQVCQAVSHAHAQLVVHRDLKPGNILVTEQGEVRLLDFGIAKLMADDRTQETALTRVSGRALSLSYASPEQIRGDPIGTASDVYSLAVVAYELLTGSLPYRLQRGSAAEREQAIASIEAPRASDLAQDPLLRKQLRGDLDAILNKALKKNPLERYPTMVALAEDIERHLDGRPVQARPESRLYLARRFVGRHRVGVAALSAVLLALGTGLGAALWQTRVAQRNEQTAESAVDREGAVKMLMMDTLSAVAAAGPAGLQAPGAVGRTMLLKLEEYEQRFKDRPEQRLGLLEAVAVQLPFFGDYEGSLAVGRRYQALLKEMKSDDWRILRSYLGNARALKNMQRMPEAEATLREALATVPDSPGAINNRVAVMSDLGKLLLTRGSRDEAIRVMDAAVQRINEFQDGSVRWDARMTQARLYFGYDDPAALALTSAAHEAYLRYPEAQSSEVGRSHFYLATALRSVGRHADAEKALRETQRLYAENFGTVDRDTVGALGRLAAAVAAQGRFAEARELLAARRRETEAQPGPDTAGALLTLTARQLETELMHGDLKAAAPFATAIPDDRTAAGAAVRDAGIRPVGQSQYLRWSGRPDAAVQRLQGWLQARPAAERWNAESFPVGAELGAALLAAGRPLEARQQLSDLMALMQAQQARRTWPYRQAQLLCALALSRLGTTADALTLLAAADAEAAGLPPPSIAERADEAAIRVQLLRAAGRWAEAAAATKTWLGALNGQHADSPRRAEARQFAVALAP